MTLSAHVEREFGDLVRRIKRYEDGTELARAQANLENEVRELRAAIDQMWSEVNEFPKRFEEAVERHIVPLIKNRDGG